jgi:AraC-like DNA-binding protein
VRVAPAAERRARPAARPSKVATTGQCWKTTESVKRFPETIEAVSWITPSLTFSGVLDLEREVTSDTPVQKSVREFLRRVAITKSRQSRSRNRSRAGKGNIMQPIVPPEDFRIRSVLQAIKSDPSVRISDLARRVSLSNSRLAHLFKAQVGQSLSFYLADERLERAACLLRETDLRVKEITYSVGYSQEPSFNRAFRKRFDCSPMNYRRQRRAADSADRLTDLDRLNLESDEAVESVS